MEQHIHIYWTKSLSVCHRTSLLNTSLLIHPFTGLLQLSWVLQLAVRLHRALFVLQQHLCLAQRCRGWWKTELSLYHPLIHTHTHTHTHKHTHSWMYTIITTHKRFFYILFLIIICSLRRIKPCDTYAYMCMHTHTLHIHTKNENMHFIYILFAVNRQKLDH